MHLKKLISFITAMAMLATLAAYVPAPVMAADGSSKTEKKASARSKYKTRKAAAMRQKVFKKLQAIQQQIDEKEYSDALEALERLRSSRRKLSTYERAQSWNITAYVYYLQERYLPAIKAYRKVLDQGELPDALVQSTLKTMSQLYFVIEDYTKALKLVKELIAVVDSPSGEVYMLLGSAYFQLENYDSALPPIKKAMDRYRQLGKAPREQWLQLLRAIYQYKSDYKNMRLVLEEMVEFYPKDRHLRTLAGVYSELGDTKKQLTIMEALYERDYKQSSSQILNLANLYLLHGIPYKAAKVLHEGLDKSERVKQTEHNYRLLSQAWYQAREDEKSIPPMRRAAKMSDDGELYIRIAQAYQNLDRWKEAADAVRSGLKKGGLKRADSAQLMLGMALFNQKKLAQAREHFELAQNDERSETVAGQWIAYVREELRRKEMVDAGKFKVIKSKRSSGG